MHVVIFVHPNFLESQSMPRYAKMLVKGLKERKHSVEVWTAKSFFQKMPCPQRHKKWLGYIDQYIKFPLELKKRLNKYSDKTLFVFADQALGPWIPLINDRPHIVHCHDFLAQRSALGEIPENKVGLTGKLYQKLIRKGYQKAKNFISVSQNTKRDLHRLLNASPKISEVVYNGLNQSFHPGNILEARILLEEKLNLDLKAGYILHVGGNQFYKNRKGVIKIYNSLRKNTNKILKLLMVGPQPTQELEAIRKNTIFTSDVYFLHNISDELLRLTYQGATAFLFPSLEEGFGWPIAEAMASGCPVVTTNEAPMNEVGGDSCFYIPRYKGELSEEKWSVDCAEILNELIDLGEQDRQKIIASGIKNASRFNTYKTMEVIESLYYKVLNEYKA